MPKMFDECDFCNHVYAAHSNGKTGPCQSYDCGCKHFSMWVEEKPKPVIHAQGGKKFSSNVWCDAKDPDISMMTSNWDKCTCLECLDAGFREGSGYAGAIAARLRSRMPKVPDIEGEVWDE